MSLVHSIFPEEMIAGCLLLSAPDAQTAADIAGSNSSKATRISFKTYSDIGYNLAYRYDFATSSVGYDYFSC